MQHELSRARPGLFIATGVQARQICQRFRMPQKGQPPHVVSTDFQHCARAYGLKVRSIFRPRKRYQMSVGSNGRARPAVETSIVSKPSVTTA